MTHPAVIAVVTVVAGGLSGWLVSRDAIGLVIGAAAGMVAAGLIIFARIRPLVAIPTVIGAVAGGFIGGIVVRLLCFPSTCVPLEVAGAALTGIGALVGIGVVVSLASRSLDEYGEAISAQRPPPQPGCESDEQVDAE